MIRPSNCPSRWLWSLLIVDIGTVKVPAVTLVPLMVRWPVTDLVRPTAMFVLAGQDFVDPVAHLGTAPDRPGASDRPGRSSLTCRGGLAGGAARGARAALQAQRGRGLAFDEVDVDEGPADDDSSDHHHAGNNPPQPMPRSRRRHEWHSLFLTKRPRRVPARR